MTKYFYISDRKMHFYLISLAGLGYEKVIPRFKKWFRTPLDLATVYRNDIEEFWFGDNREQYSKITNYYTKNPTEVMNFAATYEKECQKIVGPINSKKEKIQKLTSKQIFSDLKKLFFLVKANFQMVSISRRLDIDLTPKFKARLQSFLKLSPEKVDGWLMELTASPLPSYAAEEKRIFYEKLRKLRKPYKKNPLKKFFTEHLQKYEWVSLSYFNEPKLSMEDLKSRLKEKFEPRKEKSKSIKLPGNLRKQALCLSSAAYLKDYARGRMAFLIGIMENYFDEIENRSKISKKEIKHYTSSELKDLLLKNKRLSRKTIKERRSLSVMFKAKIHTGKQAETLLSGHHLSSEVNRNERVFKGRVACRGYTTGTVLVPESLQDFKGVHSKIILVVPNTNPAYVSFLKKVKGIVAEEGGITAHVSLISREFGIPAVVGINGVTRVFKNGDQIELDATRGIVKKL